MADRSVLMAIGDGRKAQDLEGPLLAQMGHNIAFRQALLDEDETAGFGIIKPGGEGA